MQVTYQTDEVAAFEGQLLLATEDWVTFADSWNRLGLDPYMADGGTYRRRRYSEFNFDSANDVLHRLPHVPYSQPTNINHLNGGIDRLYEPMEEDTVASASFVEAITQAGRLAQASSGNTSWLVQCFQNRITATAVEDGLAAPEGPHRDGVDYVLTLLVARENVTGGASEVYTTDGGHLSSRELTEPGEYIVLDDATRLHGVTPLTPTEPGRPGHRDVLIAMFTATPTGGSAA